MTATSSGTARVPGAVPPSAPPGAAPATCRVRSILDRVGDKWAIYVVDRLGQGPRRFSELLRGIDGITGRMLTVTLRGPKGIVDRADKSMVRIEVSSYPLISAKRDDE